MRNFNQLHPESASDQVRHRDGFTLVELLMVIMLIGILTTFTLVALAGVTEKAKIDRTTAQMAKIHELIMEKWESYLYRKLPPASDFALDISRGSRAATARVVAVDRLRAAREMMRMELPSHFDDVAQPAKYLRDQNTGKPYSPALWRSYQNRASATGIVWTRQYEGAECLYLILSQMRERDSSALSFFKENEIGDLDGDGMKEIHDAWGNPIVWLRWAPGHLSPLQQSLADYPEQEDFFDLTKSGSAYTNKFAGEFAALPRTLYPLILSAGPDGKYGVTSASINDDSGATVTWVDAHNDPYNRDSTLGMFRLGAVINAEEAADNISNHLIATR